MVVTDVFGGMWTAVGQLFEGYGGILIGLENEGWGGV
jgi:hypothetical protein